MPGYDIGFGGLDHVLASRRDVNVLVVDTEVYSNTGGQSLKPTQLELLLSLLLRVSVFVKRPVGDCCNYGYVYVTQIAIGANQSQTLKAIRRGWKA